MVIPRRSTAIALAVILCSCGLSLSQGLPTAGGEALVKSESVRVFAQMDSSSDVVRTLAKGERVMVDLRIDQAGVLWCGVRIAGVAARLGFADCRALERSAASPVAANAVTQAGPQTNTPAVAGSPKRAPEKVPFARPGTPTDSTYAAIKAATVKEGAIDSAYLLQLESQAKSGVSGAARRAALAHFAAGEFSLSELALDDAVQHFTTMESFAGQQPDLLRLSLLGRSYGLLLESEFSSALEAIERLRKLAPNSAEAATMAGWAHYRLNQPEAAVSALEAAQRLAPKNQEIAQLLRRVKSDRDAESAFREGGTLHFALRYHGGTTHALANEIMRTLEQQFRTLSIDLRYTPPEPIGVILYTRETFRDVTHAPGWASALNDGRIRVPVQGVEAITPELERVLKHELTHSFVYQKTAGRCPTWLHEGVAQWMEGKRTTREDAAVLIALFQRDQAKSLHYIPGSWTRMDAMQARFAYAWALAVVEAVEADSGLSAIDRLLDSTRTESSGEAAVRQVLHTGFTGLDETTISYLKKTFPR